MIEFAAIVLLVAFLSRRRGSSEPSDPNDIGPINPVVFGTGELPDLPQVINVLQPLVSATPRPGRFFQMYLNGPNASGNQGLLAQALNSIAPGRGSNSNLRLTLLDHMTRGWNANLYSRDKPTGAWTPLYNFRGINIGPAWLPRHENAVEAMVQGRMPKRTIAEDGAKIGDGSSYGLIWIPEIDEASLQQAASIVIRQREDGSDPYMPPRELLDLLEG